MGLYPVAGQPLYLIGSPIFSRSKLHFGNGETFVIVAEGVSEAAKYVQAAELNGRPLHRASLTHRQIIAGGELHLHMGDTPKAWDSEPTAGGTKLF